MTATDVPPRPRHDDLVVTTGQRLRLAAEDVTLRLLALTGDPVAVLLRGRPGTDPYRVYEQLRSRGRAVRSRTGIVALTGHADCHQVLRDPRFRVRDAAGLPVGYDAVTQAAQGPLSGSFLELDPPDHTRLRRLAAPAFRPKRVREQADAVRTAAVRLLDRVAAGEPFDLMAALAGPLPVAVISDLLGIPPADRARFGVIGELVGRSLDGVRTPARAVALHRAGQELAQLFRRLSAERRADPRDDVLTLLTAAQDEERITAEELVSLCGLLLVAGFETTVNLVGNGVAALLADREQWQALVADPALAAAATEETLRYDPPVQLTMRTAAEDVEVAGTALAAGTLVAPVLAAAGRDPQVYRDPARFALRRDGEPEHLAFSSGIHYCLGAPLARLEAEVAFGLLAERFPRLRPAGPGRRRPGTTIRGFGSLPVTAA